MGNCGPCGGVVPERPEPRTSWPAPERPSRRDTGQPMEGVIQFERPAPRLPVKRDEDEA